MILGGGKYRWVLKRGYITGLLRLFLNKHHADYWRYAFGEGQSTRTALALCRDDANRGDEQAITALLMLEQE
jgi:hypothetical protein